MRSLVVLLCSPLFAAALLWGAFAACVDAPVEPGEAAARLVVDWDPLACGAPHRIAVELADDAGVPVSAATPCNLGALTVDLSHFGRYRGRIYGWAIGAPAQSATPIELMIDRPIVRWDLATPP